MEPGAQSLALEWIKAIGNIIISWPALGFITVVFFRKPMLKLIEQFTSGDVRKAKFGPVEIERELNRVVEEGKQAVSDLNRINELMAESRLLELEITQAFNPIFTDDQRARLKAQIEEFRLLTNRQNIEVTKKNGE